MKVEYHPAVEAELGAVRDYYEDRVTGLGMEFLDAFESQVARLAGNPQRWMIVAGDIRRCLMKRFPYIIYFRHLGDGGIRITAAFASRR